MGLYVPELPSRERRRSRRGEGSKVHPNLRSLGQGGRMKGRIKTVKYDVADVLLARKIAGSRVGNEVYGLLRKCIYGLGSNRDPASIVDIMAMLMNKVPPDSDKEEG